MLEPNVSMQREKKYSRLLSQIIVQADLPIVALVKTLDDPQAGWLHIFAARRGNTLKNRFKVWQPFRQWLEWHRGYQYPRGVKDAIDYMQHRVSEGLWEVSAAGASHSTGGDRADWEGPRWGPHLR